MAVAIATTFKPVIQKLGTLTLVLFQVTPSGSYATGGDTLDLKPLYRYGGSNKLLFATFFSKAGYVYQYDVANTKLMTRIATTTGANIGLAEHSAAAYAAGVTGDTIYGMALFGNTQG